METVEIQQKQLDDIQKTVKGLQENVTALVASVGYLVSVVDETKVAMQSLQGNPMARMMLKNFGLGG